MDNQRFIYSKNKIAAKDRQMLRFTSEINDFSDLFQKVKTIICSSILQVRFTSN